VLALSAVLVGVLFGVLLLLVPAALLGVARIRKAFLKCVILCLAISFLIFGGVFSWFFRDGLGPDALGSVGMKAIVRFFSLYWMAFAAGLTLLILGLRRARK